MGLITLKVAKACPLKVINAVNAFITKSYKFISFYFFKKMWTDIDYINHK
jgi:hypothetical protein